MPVVAYPCVQWLLIQLYWPVMRYKTTWGRYHYEVRGSTSTYTVFPRLGFSAPASCYCTCPAFAFTVLMSNSHLMVGWARTTQCPGYPLIFLPSSVNMSLLFAWQSSCLNVSNFLSVMRTLWRPLQHIFRNGSLLVGVTTPSLQRTTD